MTVSIGTSRRLVFALEVELDEDGVKELREAEGDAESFFEGVLLIGNTNIELKKVRLLSRSEK